MYAKEVEWLPSQAKYVVSTGLNECKEERTEQELSSRSKENILTIFESSRENYIFKFAKNIRDIFATGFIDQIEIGTDSNKGLKHILIEGTPGIGKTALVKEIAYFWATNEILNETKILFLLYLRDPRLQSVTTTKQLVEYMSMGCLDDEKITALNKHLVNSKGQQLCIVMDGFNEYLTLLQKNSFIIDIINRTVLSEAIVVITSRPNAAVSLYNQVYRRFNIIGFSKKEQTQSVSQVFSQKYDYQRHKYDMYSLSNPSQKYDYWRHKYDMYSLSYPQKRYFTPLHLAVSVCLFQLGISSSEFGTLVNIIGFFVLHTVYHHTLTLPYPIDRSHNTSKSITDTLDKLSELAFKGLQEHKLVFTFDEIKQIYPHIDETVTRLGLLQTNEYYPYKRAGTNISFSFLHYTMQEFLAALHVSLLPGEQQSSWIQKTFWEDCYLFMWEMFDEIPNIIKKIQHRQYIKANIDTVIRTVITKVRNYRKDNNKHISFVKINLFPYHVSLLMFLISNLSIQWKTLEIKYCMMTDIGMSILEGCISEKLSTLEYVDLSHNDSNPWGVYCAIIRHYNVKRLALCGIKAYEMMEYVDGITNSLQMNDNLESLELCNVLGNIKPILSRIVTHVEFNLPCREVVNRGDIYETKLNIALKHKSDDSVPVSDNNRTVKINLLCPQSSDPLTIENLNSLDVSNQYIDDYGVTVVTTFCDKYNIIDLSNNRISHIGAATIGEYLKNNIFLLELNLSENNIGPNGIIAIAKAIEVNASLQKFDISCCGVADGAAAISGALKCNHSLQELDLSWNNFSNDGTKEIAEATKVNVTLQKLDISHNRISDDGAAAISGALKCNHSLQELDLSWNNISNDGTKEIAEAIQVNVTLRKLDISHNKISDDGAAAISDSLKTNNSLQVLDMSSNQIISSGARKISEAIQINSTLHTLYLHKCPVTEAQHALAFNLAVLNGVYLNNALRKLTLIRVFGNDETLMNREVEKIIKQRTMQGSSKLEILMKV